MASEGRRNLDTASEEEATEDAERTRVEKTSEDEVLASNVETAGREDVQRVRLSTRSDTTSERNRFKAPVVQALLTNQHLFILSHAQRSKSYESFIIRWS